MEDIVLPIALVNIIFVIQVIMTNTYSKNKLFDNKYIKENKKKEQKLCKKKEMII